MLIDRRMAGIEAQVSRGEPIEAMYLTYLLSSGKLTKPEVYISVTELMLGGVDTVRKQNAVASCVCSSSICSLLVERKFWLTVTV